jgi:glucose/arabinose dehydrogenase/PKD repeat protein
MTATDAQGDTLAPGGSAPPRRRTVALVAALALALLGLSGCDLPAGFHDYVVFDGLDRPTAIEFSPDGRVFVTEKRGVLKVFDGVGDRTPTVVADLRTNVYNSWDRGLLGLALHPDFPATPDVFVAYTYDALPGGTAPHWGRPGVDNDVCPNPPGETADGCVVTARVSRLRLAGNAVVGPEHVLVQDWCSQYPSHTIGTLAFGTDGALYAGGGDGASFNWADHGQQGNPCGDPFREGGALRAQDLRTDGDPVGLSGTIIRIDPATGEALPSNPLVSSPDPNARRIVAQGLRNPFRFAVRPGTSELWIGDVGWNTWEELNRSLGDDRQVDNFGWPCLEGEERTRGYDLLDLDICEDLYAEGGVAVAEPWSTYRHDEKVADERCSADRGSSISGVEFGATDGAYPDTYDGALFFADAARRCIFVMPAAPSGWPDAAGVSVFHHRAATPVDLEVGPGGELWYVDLYGGKVHRIGYSSTNSPPHAAVTATPVSGEPPLTVRLDASRSTDDDPGDVLEYAWDLDGDGDLDDATGPSVTPTYDTAGTRTVRVQVTDAAGAFDTAEATIRVGTGAPAPVIAAPAYGSAVAVGAPVPLAGSATMAGVGTLPASALSWRADLLHCPVVDQCHRHPDVFALDGAASGSFTMPDHQYPAAVEVHLSATWAGETTTVTRRVDYRTVTVTLAADTPGVTFDLAGHEGPAPLARLLPEGATVAVSAPATVTNALGTFSFASWSDGGAATHTVVVGAADSTLTAHYVPSG